MAVEGANGLIAAIADAHSLEAAGDKILRPLTDGRLGSADAPYPGPIALDGNLTADLLARDRRQPALRRRRPARRPGLARQGRTAAAASATPARARSTSTSKRPDCCARAGFRRVAAAAAGACWTRGAARVLVTDGGDPAAEASADGLITPTPPEVLVTRVTGAGDTFMAAHIAAEARGAARDAALTARAARRRRLCFRRDPAMITAAPIRPKSPSARATGTPVGRAGKHHHHPRHALSAKPRDRAAGRGGGPRRRRGSGDHRGARRARCISG